MSRWLSCEGCSELVYAAKIDRNLGVCPGCGHHFAVPAPQRIAQLLDEGSVEFLDPPTESRDPLGFVDTRPYTDRIDGARARTGLDEAAVCATGTLEGSPLAVAAMDFRFLGGSLGAAVGEMVTGAAETALREHMPLLIVTASGGARMQEGPVALMQMAKTSQALDRMRQAGLLTVSLITDPTFGGVAASFATLTDIIVSEPQARLGFAGRRVIEQTIGETLPADFQTAEFLLQHGAIDMIVGRAELRSALGRLVSAATRKPKTPPDAARPELPAVMVDDPFVLPEQGAWDVVQRARNPQRPSALDYMRLALDGFDELHGDRLGHDCPAVVGGIGRLNGFPLMVIGLQKGHDAAELAQHNFGMATPAGYRKANRLMRTAERLGLPILTLVDTPGAFPGRSAEETGQAAAIAENLRLLTGISVPVVCVITGEGGSGGALALAVADRVYILENAVYSVISPEGCASILWHDSGAAPQAASSLRMDPRSLLELGIVDAVIREPEAGAAADHVTAADRLRQAVTAALRDLLSLDEGDLLSRRYDRYRAFGAVDSPAEYEMS
ncbi:acetyl-CoA carboxylase carboxyl transferase subunit alpha [Streptomonospora sp. PA3]|uniref:acetyl-CoA carboxylase carboxyl transferase subunit alpha n=1 Tax=Streptomonospora sp. PA3 TaxID=2607326 RepID=UPI0012DDBF03|nr:acetyl-CoA carboxylase carboxyl transferase subunit alpha [Streptomonospora sp. PA3]MUL41481.1 acetyl-CoA carboxylase carboxyl transferase subunit alpha [Streptomonospora sp. PA3]